ncbi:MAG TPA: D-2-hydroxyacid dehydrogenase [Chloroflexi bacterium]|jgi:phosphoglycerate dehydrogenase-like enzyme|nr:D-2-hydroxyacid dehydrogenase [Chloroflexota bacterium]
MKVLIGANPMGLEQAIPDLQTRYPDIEFAYVDSRDKIADAIGDADVYMGWMNREIFIAAKRLKWVQSSSSGIDYYLAIPELVQSDVLLTSARGTHGACLAESAMGMIFAFTRGIREAMRCQQERVWALREIRGKLVELTGATMGIIGMGATGRALAKRAHAFDARIVGVDLYPDQKPDYVDELWGFDRLDDMLREADYIVVMVPRTPQTIDMIGEREFALMKPTAMLIGISRGGIINESALIRALREGQIAAAALDVCAVEPLPPDNELWTLDNLLITPHIAGGTQHEARYVLDIFYENLERFMQGSLPLRNQIDKARGF